jgi:hypothetical protein
LSEQKQEPKVYCPNGCGTPLVKKQFVDAFSEKKEPEEVQEDLFCPKCCIRWIPEQHSEFLGLLEKKGAAITAEQKQEIEYETVKIKVPKLVIDFVRKTETEPLEEALSYMIVDDVRAQIEGMEFKEWADAFGLTHVFWEILRDNQYKPSDAEQETSALPVASETYTALEAQAKKQGLTVRQYTENLIEQNES